MPKAARSLLALELEAGVERRLGDLELLGARLGGREPVLELVTGIARARASRRSGLRCIQPKISVEAATAPSDAASLAAGRSSAGAREASTFAKVAVASSGPDEVRRRSARAPARVGASCS